MKYLNKEAAQTTQTTPTHLRKISSKYRVWLGKSEMGFNGGDRVLFIKDCEERLLMIRDASVIGEGRVDSERRLTLPRKVINELGASVGDVLFLNEEELPVIHVLVKR